MWGGDQVSLRERKGVGQGEHSSPAASVSCGGSERSPHQLQDPTPPLLVKSLGGTSHRASPSRSRGSQESGFHLSLCFLGQ